MKNINKQYDNSDIGIYFPNLNIYDCYELEMKRNPVACDVYIENISFKMKVLIDEIPLVWAIYCVLHEYGHCLHFKDSELTPFKYREERIEEQSKYSELVNAIRDISELDPCKKYIAEQYQKNVYMKYSDEKYANEYAIDHIVEAYNKVKQHI